MWLGNVAKLPGNDFEWKKTNFQFNKDYIKKL